jgi:hypothetical protein
MISGIHAVVFSPAAEEVRAFFRDTLAWDRAVPAHSPAACAPMTRPSADTTRTRPGMNGVRMNLPATAAAGGGTKPGWHDLPPAALAFRAAHIVYGVGGMASFGYLWACALTRRRNRKLALAIGFLALEGAALVVGRGNCPFGALQRRLGDDVPMFELFLSPRAAKAAVPVLAGLSLAGMALVAFRPPASTR